VVLLISIGPKTTKHDGELLDTYFDYVLEQLCSKRQATNVLSSIEVGYKAMIKGMEKGIWRKTLLAQIRKTIENPSQFILIIKFLKEKYISVVIPLGLLAIS
jgi:hypothetical protein